MKAVKIYATKCAETVAAIGLLLVALTVGCYIRCVVVRQTFLLAHRLF